MWDSDELIGRMKLRRKRITAQRRVMIDVIAQSPCRNCKELCQEIARTNPEIGQATVYRLLSTLEEIGAIRRYQGFERTELPEYVPEEDPEEAED